MLFNGTVCVHVTAVIQTNGLTCHILHAINHKHFGAGDMTTSKALQRLKSSSFNNYQPATDAV